MQPDPEHDARVRGLAFIGFTHRLLELNGATQRVHRAGELDQCTIAGELDQPATILGQDWIKALSTVLLQTRDCAALVPPHQAGIADHIGGNDSREATLLTGHEKSPVSST